MTGENQQNFVKTTRFWNPFFGFLGLKSLVTMRKLSEMWTAKIPRNLIWRIALLFYYYFFFFSSFKTRFFQFRFYMGDL